MELLDLTLLKKDSLELRDYQVIAAENAIKEKKALVVMPTALGKTFIAVLVAAHVLSKAKNKKILFLTPTKPLATQQAKRFSELLDYPADSFVTVTGEVKPEKRLEQYKNSTVICGTPQTIMHDVLARRLSLNDFSLVVFDEAHRAVGDYAYVFLGKHIQNPDTIVLGLTASPSSKIEKILEICANIGVKHIELKTEKDENVKEYVNEVKLDWVFVNLTPEILELRQRFSEMLKDDLTALKQADYLPTADVNRVTKRELLALRPKILQDTKTNVRAYASLSILAKAMNLTHAIDVIESQGLTALAGFIQGMHEKTPKTKAVTNILADFRFTKIQEKLKSLIAANVEHPKVKRLKDIVSDQTSQGKSVIVFAHYRDSVTFLVSELNTLPGVTAKAFVGRAEGGMTQKEQAATLDAFRNKQFNVLVSTSVAEEGIDVPAVDLVVFYEAVPSEIRSIQRRGRAGRTHVGSAVCLITKNSKDEAFFWIAKRKEKQMKESIAFVSKQFKEDKNAEEGQTKEQKSIGDF